jgi:hypothetical protein
VTYSGNTAPAMYRNNELIDCTNSSVAGRIPMSVEVERDEGVLCSKDGSAVDGVGVRKVCHDATPSEREAKGVSKRSTRKEGREEG